MRPHRAKMSDDMLEMLMHLEMQWQLKAIQTSPLIPSHHPSLRRSCLIIMPSGIVKLVNCTATIFYLLITALLSQRNSEQNENHRRVFVDVNDFMT